MKTNHVKFFLIIAFILMLSVISCYSQNNWKPGYIVENSGDTIYGFIDDRDSRSNTKRCFFGTEEFGEKKILGPKDISGFRFVNGKYFVSKTITSGDSTRRMFLEFIVQGKADLFHYKDDGDLFFIEKEGRIYELKNTSENLEIKGVKYDHEKKEYIQVLRMLMQDADMQQEISRTTLSANSLINIAKTYHNRVCPEEQCIVYEKKNNIQVKWGLHFGESVNTINFGEKWVSNNGISSFIGCRITFENVLDWAENVSFSTDIAFHRFSKYELHSINYGIATRNYNALIEYNNQIYDYSNDTKLNVDLKVVAMKVPITINYIFSRGNIRPYVSLGISNTFILSQNKDFVFRIFYDNFNASIPRYLILGYVGRCGIEFMLKNNHSIYSDINLDYTQNSESGGFIFSNKMYSLTMGYAF